MEKTISSLWLTDYKRLESLLRLSAGTYQLRIILRILPAVMDWCLKLRTNYGRGNQNDLLTLGNDETALSPHPVTEETNQEAKTTKELFALAVNFADELDELLAKNTYWRTTRVCA